MAGDKKFDALAAVAGLPGYPAPQDVRGPDLHHARIGTTRIRMLSDGAMTLPFRALCPEATPSEAQQVFGIRAVPEWGRGEITAVLLEIGAATVLVDAGAGRSWQAGAGRLLDHMAANAIAPETVTHLVLTHLHPDHAWGALTSAGHPVFPGAKVFVGRKEAAFWSKPGLADRVQPAFRDTVLGAVQVLKAYDGRLVEVAEGDEIAPGLSVLETPGHSPGHISLLLSGGDGLILTGDALIHEIVSFARPDWSFGFDTDADLARVSRRRLLDLGADGGHAMLGGHWSWPGLGYADRAGDAFRFRGL